MPLTKATPFLIKIYPQNFHPQRSSFKSPETARNPCKAGSKGFPGRFGRGIKEGDAPDGRIPFRKPSTKKA